MKKTISKIAAAVLSIFVISIALAGCGASKPTEVVDDMLGTIQDGKITKLDKFMADEDASEVFNEDELVDTNDKKLVKNLFNNYEYGKPVLIDETEDTAQVKVEVTSVDLGEVGLQVFAEVTPYALEHADDEEKIEKRAKKIMIEKLKEKDAPMNTREIVLDLAKVDGDWKVEMNNNVLDALYYGL